MAGAAGDPRLHGIRRRKLIIRLSLAALLAVFLVGCGACMFSMPGRSWSGSLPPVAPRHLAVAAALRRDVEMLAGTIGSRNLLAPDRLERAATYIETRLKESGLAPQSQHFTTRRGACRNIEAEIRGRRLPDEIVVVGAHYDSAYGCPGANDNATGVAALLALAAALSGEPPSRTIRFVVFVNEEPPFFQTDEMGSRVYARRCRERGEKIVAMLSLETMGSFSDDKGSQKYPWPVGLFYPSRGDFIAFVGNLGSRSLVRRLVGSFRTHAQFPSEGAALPSWITGVGWSDHDSFWREGYSAVMVTDTAVFRYPHYHSAADTPDKIDYSRCARVVVGLETVFEELADE
jgi:hypothetical protein